MCASPNDISGTWFPSGFHGHFRSKTRTDFTIPYRQRAKPVPPQKFLNFSKERSNRHLFSRHDNRNAHSNMGDLEAFFNMGLGKRKFVTSGHAPSQHNKNTRDLITWSGNESKPTMSTYRSHFERSSTPMSVGWNEAEPIHIRSNLHLQRRHYRAASAPPSHQRTAPLLAWNNLDETYSSKPGVGSRTLRTQMVLEQPSRVTQNAPNASSNNNYTVSETVTPLNTTC